MKNLTLADKIKISPRTILKSNPGFGKEILLGEKFCKELVSYLEDKSWNKKNVYTLMSSSEVKRIIKKHYKRDYMEKSEIGQVDDTLLWAIATEEDFKNKASMPSDTSNMYLRDVIYNVLYLDYNSNNH